MSDILIILIKVICVSGFFAFPLIIFEYFIYKYLT